MQYHCVQCDERFSVASSDDKPRCPKCLRQHGLRKLEETPKASARGGRPAFLLPVIVLLVAALGYAGFRYTGLHRHSPTGLAPLDADELRERIKAVAQVDAGKLGDLFVADSDLAAFAARVTQGKSSDAQKAQAVVQGLAERAKKQAFVPWSRTDARDGAPLSAADTWRAIAKDGARRQLYPLELAAVAVAALRSVDVPALLAEVYRYDGERTALDPSGRLGYHAVALLAEPNAQAQLFDAYGARSQAPKPGDFVVLNDVQAAGAAFSLRALNQLANAGNLQAALADADVAVKLNPGSPSVRSARGAIVLSSGGADEGSRELEAAAQQRNDAARHNNVAMLALAKNDPERATKEISLALAELPDFASAHLTLASVHLARGEADLAKSELERAESLDPELPALPLAWAELYAGSGDNAHALMKAQQGVALRPKNPETHLVLARVDRQAGRYDDMRREAQKVLELSPITDKDRVKDLLRAMLGPTVFEVPTEPAAVDPPQDPGAHPEPGTGTGTAPSPDLKLSPGSLQLGSSASKLHLGGGSGSQLKLDLSH